MTKRYQLRKKHVSIFFIVLLLVAAAFTLFGLFSVSQARKSDYTRISSEEYDTVFLSMFPIDNYAEDDYAYYRAQSILKTDYSIPDIRTLQTYMKKIANSGNAISTIYLGIRPEKIDADELSKLLSKYSSANYHIILSYPSIEYWTSLSEQELQETFMKYQELANTLLYQSNTSLYLFSQEWLICNPANYEAEFLTTKDISHTLMVNCDKDHNFVLTPENIDSVFAEFFRLLKTEYSSPTTYADLSKYKIVFLGDSVIGNYTDSASIPGVVNGLTGATVYNCGFGGGSAAYYPDCPLTLTDIVEAFIQADPSALPEDGQVSKGITQYIQDSSDTEQLCFVINYGLNDYFNGVPVSAEDPRDTASYSGALRTSVTTLLQAYPDAKIILLTPNFTSYFANGEERKSDVGGILTDYVDAVLSVGNEYHLPVLDNYTGLNINSENHGSYLADGCHPNETTRFTIGKKIAQLFTKQ